MEKTIKEIRDYSLSIEDIQDLLDPDTKIFTYPQFCTMQHIDEAFDSLGRCVFLFLTESATSGHWLCMFKRKDHIEYFDSYGEPPEAQREWLTEEQLEELGEDEPYLYRLLKSSGYKVYYNAVAYQSDRKDVATCGRWCVARLICKDFTNKQFYDLVREQTREVEGARIPDDWVSLFTYQFIGK